MPWQRPQARFVKTVKSKSGATEAAPAPKPVTEQPAATKAATAPAEPATRVSADAPDVTRKSIAFYELPDGSIDPSRLQERTRAQLKKLLSDRTLAGKLGMTGPAVPAPSVVSPELVNGFYTVLGGMESLIGQKLFKVPAELANRAFTLTDEQKKSLTPLTVKVANKYAWTWLQNYGDEIALAMVFVSITVSQIALLKSLQAQGLSSTNGKTAGASGISLDTPPHVPAADIQNGPGGDLDANEAPQSEKTN